jgi:nucleotide sugar dehydrogenase
MTVPDHFEDRDVAVIGLGYVGLTLAVALADVGFRVWGIERSNAILECLAGERTHFAERGLDAKLARQLKAGRLNVSATIPLHCAAKVFIVTVGTPLGPNAKIDLDSISTAAGQIRDALKPDDMVILRSTVRIGVTRQVVKPILDEAGVPFDLSFCPERALEGKALQELRRLPQVIGGLTPDAALRAARLFHFLTPTIISVPDLESAELVKLINNSQRDLSFAVANEVAAICDAVGVSATQVISACNTGYTRSHIAWPGPVGGPCLQKDSHILAEGLTPMGYRPALTTIARRLNEELPKRTVFQIKAAYSEMSQSAPRKILILGLAFKGEPETNDLRGTMAIPIIQAITEHFPNSLLFGYDPVVSLDAASGLGIRPCASLEEAFRDAGIVIIQNNHSSFANMQLASLSSIMARPGIIYDYWNLFSIEDLLLPTDVTYCGLGNSWVLRSERFRNLRDTNRASVNAA